MDFPRLMFRSPGPEQCQGGTYAQKLVQDEEQFSAGLQEGFHGTLPEALAPAPVIIATKLAEPDENAPPTSEELRAKAKELGLVFKRNATDEEIGKLIATKLAEA
ncbi:MAG: hypothetical protein V4641_31310 [Pseudomonadota bacterium]